MKKIYFTIAGTQHHYGSEVYEKGNKVKLVKEPQNPVDQEAIRVELEGLGLAGYVANSPYTVLGESMSAGRLYDCIGNTANGTVCYLFPNAVICQLDEEDIIYAPPAFKEDKKKHCP